MKLNFEPRMYNNQQLPFVQRASKPQKPKSELPKLRPIENGALCFGNSSFKPQKFSIVKRYPRNDFLGDAYN